jgi:hypothetical protein
MDLPVSIMRKAVLFIVEETEVATGWLECVMMAVRRDGVDLSVELKVKQILSI